MSRPAIPDQDERAIYTMSTRKLARGSLKKGKPSVWIRFPPTLFAQIRNEALHRGVSFTAIVIELCSASIEGIE